MRVLVLRHDSVKRAIEIREAMVDSAAGWRWIKTVRQAWGPPVVQRRTGGVLPIHECGHTDGRCGEDDEAAKWEEKGRARLEQ